MPITMSFFITRFSLILVFVNCAWSSPQQMPLQPGVQCEAIDKFSTEWFLTHTLDQYRKEIPHKALFYTRNTSEQAKALARSSNAYVTIWEIWPPELYNNSSAGTNSMRCIHGDDATRTTFYENMSRAYARMARQSATIMHLHADYDAPPLDGIWGRIELPVIQNSTDVVEMRKIDEDRGRSTRWLVSGKSARDICERAMKEVRDLFLQATGGSSGGGERKGSGDGRVVKRSSPILEEPVDSFLDGLW